MSNAIRKHEQPAPATGLKLATVFEPSQTDVPLRRFDLRSLWSRLTARPARRFHDPAEKARYTAWFAEQRARTLNHYF
jgi:hypothetical protein